jgi:hypothetical protein
MATRKIANPNLDKVAPLPAKTGPKTTSVPAPASPGTALTSYKDRMAALVAQTKRAETPTGGFISTKGGHLTINGTQLPGDKINAIVIDYRRDNEYYPKAFAPNEAQAPICAAIVAPDEIPSPWRKLKPGEDPSKCEHYDKEFGLVTDMPEPQVKPGFNCDSCRMLEWGSAVLIIGKTGSGKGKACRESRRLHVFAADQCTTPADIERAPFMTLIPPPTSAQNFSTFANEVAEVLGLPIFGAVVEISVKPHDQFQFMVYFKILEAINDQGRLAALLNRHEQIRQKPIMLPKPDDDKTTKDSRGSKF